MKQEIIIKCSELFKIHPRDLLGRYRFDFIMPARFALYKALRMRGWSYPEIGRKFDRDHSTVIYGVKRAEYMMLKDAEYAAKVVELAKMKYAVLDWGVHTDAEAATVESYCA